MPLWSGVRLRRTAGYRDFRGSTCRDWSRAICITCWIGPAVRRLAYEEVFADREIFARYMLPKKGTIRLLNPLRRRVMKGMLKWHFGITRERLRADRVRMSELLTELQARLGERRHFVGDTLTIADIAVASLMNPLEIVRDFSQARDYDMIFAWMRALRSEHGRLRRWTR